MNETANLWLYFLVVFGIIVLPGLDMAFVVANSLTGGNRAGFAAVAGIVAGGVCHVVMGALGIAAILTLWPAMFNIMLLAGALYIGWTGWTLMRSSEALGFSAQGGSTVNQRSVFVRGMTTCLLNPKAYVFMLAVFPQFLAPDKGPLWIQASALGVITAFTQAAVYGTVALLAVRAARWLDGNPDARVNVARGVGVVLMLAALLTGMRGWQTL
jgi:threonine/homoserine/homoserine lactone efflux protein